jgi:hypothetical protein
MSVDALDELLSRGSYKKKSLRLRRLLSIVL